MTFRLGQTLFNAPQGEIERHPWIIASDPEKAEGVVLVNFSTKPMGKGPECVVQPAEHKSLSRRSYLRCDLARLRPLVMLEEALKKGLFQESDNVSAELLKKLQQALLDSPLTAREVKELLRAQGFPAP